MLSTNFLKVIQCGLTVSSFAPQRKCSVFNARRLIIRN